MPAAWAEIVRRQGIDLGDAREACDNRAAHGAAGADLVALAFGEINKLFAVMYMTAKPFLMMLPSSFSILAVTMGGRLSL